MDERSTIQRINPLTNRLMEQVKEVFSTAVGFGALLLVFNDEFVIDWLNQRLDRKRKASAKRAGSLDRITRSRYQK